MLHSEIFEIDGHSIYSVIQEPSGEYIADFAVLLCYPFGDEYMRSHRAFRQLEFLLARKGVVSMRFDYAGTGDSSGDSSDFSLGAAKAQIVSMTGELEKLAAVNDVRVVGLRLGAALAYEALSEVKTVNQIAWWDPVISGEQYLKEMRNTITPDRKFDYIVDGTWWVNGYSVTNHLRQEIEVIDLHKLNCQNFKRILHLTAKESEDALQLRDSCIAEHHDFTYKLIANQNSSEWIQEDIGTGTFMFASQVYETLVNWLTE